MSLSVDFLSILLFITLAQGLFILSVLLIRYKIRPVQHLYLFLLVLLLLWFQAEFLSVRLPYDVTLQPFYGTRYGAWMLVGPLFYFYARAITGKPITSLTAIAIHVSPFVIFVWIIPLLTSDFLSSRQINYGMLSTFDPFNDSVSFIQYVYASLFVTQFFHGLLYLIVIRRLIRNYETNLRGNYSSLDVHNIRWLQSLTILLVMVIILVSSFLILFFVTRSYNRDLDYLYVIPTALLTYLIGYKLSGVTWALAPDVLKKTPKYEKSSLKAGQAQAHTAKLEKVMIEVKPYLNNELRLQDLANMLDIPPHHLSQVINEQLHTTFFDYINHYRVEEAKRFIVAEPKSSLLEIAFKAGFNNKTSFTNAFKKRTSQTPVEFRKQHRAN